MTSAWPMILNVAKAKPAASASRMRMRAVMAAPWGTADVTAPSPRRLPRHRAQGHGRHAAERRSGVHRLRDLAAQRETTAARHWARAVGEDEARGIGQRALDQDAARPRLARLLSQHGVRGAEQSGI